MSSSRPLAFQGTICHTRSIGAVEVLTDYLLVVNAAGTITHLGSASTPDAAAALLQQGLQAHDVDTLSQMQLLLPGFIDTHFHAPQYTFTGVGTDLPLFDWLSTYTFPEESRFSDKQHAEAVYRLVVQRLLRLGTTTANYFTTLHVEACKVLVDVVCELGQRAVVGKTSMDQHGPDLYLDQGVDASLQGTREVVQYIKVRTVCAGHELWGT
jgi:guanine deaminase